ncbi:long-chain-fatty-acid--CoA ligase [Azospirillum sp. A29]|uniref:long-chain-fatty-acid--CoA ligase n=1 Tax=Azospirillum sp. A29 TaxID=3160606 RepID=UPI00366EC924
MRSTMMNVPLMVSSILRHAALNHGDTEIVSRTVEGPLHRTTYAKTWTRSQQLANALAALGLGRGDRVGTLAWNGYRHLEIYYGASGAGHVCHTINPRLFPDQIAYIVNHAGDRMLFVELSFVEMLESIADRLTGVEVIVVMTDAAHMPTPRRLPALLCYEDLLAVQPDRFDWPQFDENEAAAMCYTSGTTGDPKGVLYSHRSIVLHAMAVCMPDVFALGAGSVAMPVVPMFHVNAWGLPYAAALVGAKLVLPGPKLDGASLHELIIDEEVSFTAGVPTIWMALLDWAAANDKSFGPLKRVAVGGSACPPAMFARFRDHKVEVLHAWGMTETSPVGLANSPKPNRPILTSAQETAFSAKQGRPLFGMEFRVVGGDGTEIAHDGIAFGNMQVRGPWVAAGYFRGESEAPQATPDWFETGDVVTMDADGYVQIVDRSKDVIKSGGEWISSIDLESIAMAHPAVQEAAVVAHPDERWSERPLLVVVRRPGSTLTEREILAHYQGKVARWWIPDHAIFVDELPHTATGKLLKAKIRELYGKPSSRVTVG